MLAQFWHSRQGATKAVCGAMFAIPAVFLFDALWQKYGEFMLETVSHTRRVSARATLTILLSGLLLTGCGNSDDSDVVVPSPDEASSAQASETKQAVGGSMVNSFSFDVTGIAAVHAVPSAEQLTLVGGCTSESPVNLIFMRGTPGSDDYFYFSLETAAPVTTQIAESSTVTWDNGAETPPGLPEDSPIKVPARLTGPGSLTITSQSGRGLAGQMAGTAEGVLTNSDTQETATISAAFDVNLSCGG